MAFYFVAIASGYVLLKKQYKILYACNFINAKGIIPIWESCPTKGASRTGLFAWMD